MLSLNARFATRTHRIALSRSVRRAAASTSAPSVSRIPRTTVPKEAKPENSEDDGTPPFIHVIEESRWPNGIPAVQGAHLMASGSVAPISTSKGVLAATSHMFEYPDGTTTCSLAQYPGEAAAAEGLADMTLMAAEKAIQEKGTFSLVLSGGSLVKLLGNLSQRPAEWDKWHVFWVDERVVSHDDPDSNYKGAKDAFLSNVDIPEANVYPIAENLKAKEAATHYEGILMEKVSRGILPRDTYGFPVFDLILLGIGPDGHIASLFPNRSQTASTEGWVLSVEDSPKPPPQRITFSMPVINAAKQVAIVALGDGKAEIVQRVLEVQCLPGALPAQMVRPQSSDLTWILDGGSSKLLKIPQWEKTQSFPRNKA